MDIIYLGKNLTSLIGKNLKSYQSHIKQFEDFLESHSLIFGESGIDQYLKWSKEKYRNPNSYNVKIASIKSLVRFLFKNSPQYFDFKTRTRMEDYLETLKLIKINSNSITEEKVMTEKEVQKLIDRLTPRWQLLVKFLFSTGLRISETVGIKLIDLEDFQTYYKIAIVGKGQKSRVIKVEKNLVENIKQVFAGTTFLFETKPYKNGSKGGKPLRREYVSKFLGDKTWEYLGTRHSAHHFRHSFATTKIRESGNVKGVSQYLGHSDAGFTLRVYVHQELSLSDLGIAQ